MPQLNYDEISQKYSLCVNTNEVDEFSKRFKDYINFLQVTHDSSTVLKCFCEILHAHKKPEICRLIGLQIFMEHILVNGGKEKFIEDPTYISLEQLMYFDFSCFSTACLNLISNKIVYFLKLWRDNHSSNYNYIAMTKLYILLLRLHDNNELTVFNKISKLKLILELVVIIDKPYLIKQPANTNLCGPTAIITYMCVEMPEQFIMIAEEFFDKGLIDKPFKMLASDNSKNNDISVITAMMIGMKHASNYYAGYNNKFLNKSTLLEKYCGLTEPSQMVNWLQSLGCSDVYEDLEIHVPFTRYNMPHTISNVLLWRQVYSVNHKTIANITDRLPILEEFIAFSDYKKIILLFCEDFWFDIVKNYYKETHDIIISDNLRHKLNIGHYVYLYSLNVTAANKFECVFYNDGKLIKTVMDKTTFLKGLKGVISMNNFLKQQEFLRSRANKRKRSEDTQSIKERPVKKQKVR